MTENSKGTWTPGWRRTPSGSTTRIGDNILALGSMSSLRMFIFVEDPKPPRVDDGLPLETGKNILLQFQFSTRKFKLNLAAYNSAELKAIREIITHALDKAEIVVTERDRIAEEAHEQGDDTFLRRHRPDPRISYFEREIL